jgi:hypothetical protein
LLQFPLHWFIVYFLPASVVAVLIQIRDGKEAKQIGTAIEEARQTIKVVITQFGASPSEWTM